MYNEKERREVNKFLSMQTFTCSVPFLSLDSKYEINYRFEIVGERRMISVGEYYMYAMARVEILDVEEKYKKYIKILGSNYDRDEITNIFFTKEYLFQTFLGSCLSEILKYTINGEDYPRVNIINVIMSDELYDNIMDLEI